MIAGLLKSASCPLWWNRAIKSEWRFSCGQGYAATASGEDYAATASGEDYAATASGEDYAATARVLSWAWRVRPATSTIRATRPSPMIVAPAMPSTL